MKRGRGAGAFTLVELMLAVLILSIVMSLIYGVVTSTVLAQHRIEEIMAANDVGPSLLAEIRHSLEGAFVPKADVEYFVGRDGRGSTGDRDRIDFVTATMAYGSEVEGEEPLFHGTNEVGYQVQDNRNEPGVGILYRREDYFVDRDPLKDGRLTELYDRVTHFSLSFWDGQNWKADWNNKRDGGKLPRAIKIELKLLVSDRDEPRLEKAFTTTLTFPR